MKGYRFALTAAVLGAAAVALPAAGTAVAKPQAAKAPAAVKAQGWSYEFRGHVTKEPGAGATSIEVQVKGGNRIALKALLGAAQPTTFLVDAKTRWISYDGRHPKLTSSAGVHLGDPVTVRIQARRNSALADILKQPAKSVSDFAGTNRPRGAKLYLYGGKAVSVDTTNKKLTVEVNWGNWRALYTMLGQPTTQTFTYDAETVFVTWKGGGPRFLTPEAITPGDPLKLRIWAAKKTPLSTLVNTPLWKVNDREPAILTVKDKGDAE